MPADNEERERDRRGDHQPEREDEPGPQDEPGREDQPGRGGRPGPAAEGDPSRPRRGGGWRLPEFIGRLRRAGLDPTPESVAEALWLAHWVASGGHGDARGQGPEEADSASPPGGGSGRGPEPGGEEEPEDAAGTEPAPDDGPGSAPHPGAHSGPRPVRSPTVSLYAPERHSGAPGDAFAVRAPAVGTLPGLLGLQRAMRPLLGYRSRVPSVTGPLDEAATADLSARNGAVRLAFGRSERRETEVQLLMDASATTSIWQLTFDSLRQTCEQLGAFRDVSARYLHRASDGTPMIGTGPDRETTRLRPAHQYRDTTGRRLTLIVSDCVGPLWQDGGAQRLLHSWSAGSPLAIVQPLPPRMWRRTALPAEPGLLVRDRDMGGRLSFEPDGYGQAPEKDAVPVPVLLPTPAALGSWARLLGGGGQGTARGAAAWVRPRHPASHGPGPTAGGGGFGELAGALGAADGGPRDEDPRQLLDTFRASASASALDLVVHLAPVPLLLPVIHLVQAAILPDTGPAELAEVLLSGLLERLPDIAGSPGPRYEFKPGVRDLLMQSLDRGAIVLLLKHVSDYVERRFGKVSHNFPAMAVERLSGRGRREGAAGPWREPGEPWDEVTDDLFAQIPARVIRWYEPWEPVPSGLDGAERLLRRWWEQGDPQLLWQAREYAEEAVSRAAGADPGRTGHGRGDVDVADRGGTDSGGTDPGRTDPGGMDATGVGAADAGGTGVPAPVGAGAACPLLRARLVLGRVLHALTDTGDVRRDPERARELLHAAARQLTASDQDTRFELAAVLHDLWRAERDSGHLREAARTLRAMAEEEAEAGRPLSGAAEARRRLWLGRVLLAGASAEGRTDAERRSDAERAVAELSVAAELLTETGDSDSQLCAVLLDLSGALRQSGAPSGVRLANLERARTAAGDDDTLRMRCARARARVNRDDGDAVAADLAYAEAEDFTAREGLERCELLTEWGTMLLDDTEEITRAEGLLREALTRAPSDGPLPARLQLLLGRALVARYHGGGFLPDLYEGCHLLEQSARRAQGPGPCAEAWLRLGSARLDFPEGHVTGGKAAEALSLSLRAAREARGEAPASAAVARALHVRGQLAEAEGELDEALSDYRAAAAEWRRLVSHFPDEVPWNEVALTRERIAALEAG